MTNTRENWDEVRLKIEGLGMKLKYHLESELHDDDETDDDRDDDRAQDSAAEDVVEDAVQVTDEVTTDSGSEAVETGEHDAEAAKETKSVPKDLKFLLDGVEKFVDMVDDAFDALGNASKDDAVREDVRDIAEVLRNAFGATLHDAGADLRDILNRTKARKSESKDSTFEGEIIDPDGTPEVSPEP